MQSIEAERLFSGLIGEEYEVLKCVCPAAAEMSRRVGEVVAGWRPGSPLAVFEIGCGTGITTLALLLAGDAVSVTALDNEPAMLGQARRHLADWVGQGRLHWVEADALSGLRALPDASVDVVASGYATHNFLQGYRDLVMAEVFRVLRPGGALVNGDRYALDDVIEHTRLTQQEVRGWFRAFADLGRADLLEQWVVHLFSDESEGRIMRLGASVDRLRDIGFEPVEVAFREGVNTLLIAHKPVINDG
ncbi:MAG: class I SAM-dependent methyltransferase [Candidatus Methylumidiphilus sp.]